MEKEVIRSEFRKLIEEHTLDVLVFVFKKKIIGWLPFLGGGIAGKIFSYFLIKLLKPVASELATWGNFLKIDGIESSKLENYKPRMVRIKSLHELYKGLDLTEEERKENEAFDSVADNLIRW